MATKVNIIPIGGGKGGIGKSVVSTNLAVGIALSGQKVILMDGDFGASNLHAYLVSAILFMDFKIYSSTTKLGIHS